MILSSKVSFYLKAITVLIARQSFFSLRAKFAYFLVVSKASNFYANTLLYNASLKGASKNGKNKQALKSSPQKGSVDTCLNVVKHFFKKTSNEKNATRRLYFFLTTDTISRQI